MAAESVQDNSGATAVPLRLADCSEIFVLYNEYSTRGGDVLTEVRRLQAASNRHDGRTYDLINTRHDRAQTIQAIGKLLLPKDPRKGLVLAGGDATQSDGLDAGLELGLEVPIGLYRGGNANNLPTMANPKRFSTTIPNLIDYGVATSIYPIEITTTLPGEPAKVRRVYAHFGVGASGGVAHTANEKEHRDSVKDARRSQRFLMEGIMTLSVIARQPPLTIEDIHGRRPILDLTIMNGNRIAKGIYIAGMLLNEPRAAIIDIPYPTHENRFAKWSRFGTILGKAMLSNYATLEMGGSYDFAITNSGGETYTVHYDGESEDHPSGTAYSVRFHDSSSVPVQVSRPNLVAAAH